MIKVYPSFDELKEKVSNINKKTIIPIWGEIIADLETPVSAFHKICEGKKYSYLLESVEGGESFGRYSFIGTDPLCVLKSDNSSSAILDTASGCVLSNSNNPYSLLKEFLASVDIKDTGLDYSHGMVGYFGYDSIRHIEPKLEKSFKKVETCESFPQACLMLAGTVLIFDHVKHRIMVVCNILADYNTDLSAAYKEACKKIEDIIGKLTQAHNLKPLNIQKKTSNTHIDSNITKNEWITAIKIAKEHIKAGDIFQVVLSQRFCIKINNTEPFEIYRVLRNINPSPYLYYLNFEDFKIIGSSPEIMVKCSKDKTAYIRPIAGTRPRGKTSEEDIALAKDLLADPKERAEHIMLVDLGRNDLGRVCEFGSVKVNDLMHIEKYSHVQHIVSDVTGRLMDKFDSIDLVKACFPAGTVSGAPKIRAMEIIYDLEKSARGPYAGCIGHFGFNNELNTAITIRTMLVKDDKVFIQAGAGIVADSDPETEYTETQNKAAALVQTVLSLDSPLC